MSGNMELDLDNRDRCNVLLLRQPTPTPGDLQAAAQQFLGERYEESHYPHLSAEAVILATNVGMRMEQMYLRGRRIHGIACSLEPRARQALVAILAGIRNLRTNFTPPMPHASEFLSPWNSDHNTDMARSADRRIDAKRKETGSPALPDYEETAFQLRSELGIERLMIDTYHATSRAVSDITSEFVPGNYVVVGHAPNISLFACGKLREAGDGGLWDALTTEHHIRVLGGVVVPGQAPMFRTLQPCEGFWYMVDNKNQRHGLIPIRHSPGISLLHRESMELQDQHRKAFIERELIPAQKQQQP